MVIGVAGWRRRRRRPKRRPPRSRQPHLSCSRARLVESSCRRPPRPQVSWHPTAATPAQGTSGACAGLRCLRAKLRGQRALRWAGCAPCALRRAVRHFGLVCPFRLVLLACLLACLRACLLACLLASDLPTFLFSEIKIRNEFTILKIELVEVVSSLLFVGEDRPSGGARPRRPSCWRAC